LSIEQQGKELGYRSSVLERWTRFFGEERTRKLISAFERPIPPAIRINTLREDKPEILIKKLGLKGFKLEKLSHFPKFGYQILDARNSIGVTTEYLLGKVQMQSLASQIPVEILNPQEGETVGDFCASPGVKLSQIAQWMNNHGVIVGIEKATSRIRRLKSNITRLGVSTIVLRMDAIYAPNLDLKFNKILVDAPCSGSGIIRKDKMRKTMKSREVRRLSRIQFGILQAAVQCLENQGEILYSTCSLEPEENEFVITKILERYPEISLNNIPKMLGMENGLDEDVDSRIDSILTKSGRIYPEKGHEGFFIALLCKE